MANLHDRGFFASPSTRTAKEKEQRHQDPVFMETIEDDSDDETEGEDGLEDRAHYGKMKSSKSDDYTTLHTTKMTDDDISIIGDMREMTNMETSLPMDLHRAFKQQTKILVNRVQELAEENAILRMQNSKTNRILKILLEDFKGMDICDVYFPDGRLK
jgi:hypothetical protein